MTPLWSIHSSLDSLSIHRPFVLFPDADFWSMISQSHGPFIVSEKAFFLWLDPHNITSKSACFRALLLFIDISTMDELAFSRAHPACAPRAPGCRKFY
jgi:hypothetical protein